MSEVIDKTGEEIQIWIEKEIVCLIDVREDHEYAQARIPNTAIHMPLSRFDPEKIPSDSAQKLVFVCAQGLRSMQAGQYLLDNGFIKEAYNLKDGIAGWSSLGLPIQTD